MICRNHRLSLLKPELERLYAAYNGPQYIHPDPLQFVLLYRDVRDREIAAILASSLAYGRVAQILRSVSCVLEEMGESPHRFLRHSRTPALRRAFACFTHRFATGRGLAGLLTGIRALIGQEGSLYRAFLKGYAPGPGGVVPALAGWVKALRAGAEEDPGHLLPDPGKGSACKRLNLFLRWMVRKDAVDPGGWEAVSPADLVVPLDIHMFRASRELGFTRRLHADMAAALEVTGGFRQLRPEDPLRYDFVLTRAGIWGRSRPEGDAEPNRTG